MIEFKYRTFWRRFCAGLIDGILFYPFIKLNEIIWGYHGEYPAFLFFFWYIINSLMFCAYDIVMHGYFGQTLGKMIARVRVVDITESPLSMLQAFKREIISLCFIAINITLDVPKILSGVNIMDPTNFQYDASFYFSMTSMLGLFMAEMTTMLFSRKRRAIHDFIAGSVVIKLIPTSQSGQSLRSG